MSSTREPRPYVNPYLGGVLLGVALFLSFFFTGGGLGASAGLSHIQIGVLDWLAPSHVDRVAYFAEVAGGHRSAWGHYAIYMMLGTAVGAFVSGLFNRRVKLETRKGPRISVGARLFFAALGGAIFAYGARLGRGCTSGQALSGGATLAAGSWALMFAIFASAYLVAWLVRRLWT